MKGDWPCAEDWKDLNTLGVPMKFLRCAEEVLSGAGGGGSGAGSGAGAGPAPGAGAGGGAGCSALGNMGGSSATISGLGSANHGAGTPQFTVDLGNQSGNRGYAIFTAKDLVDPNFESLEKDSFVLLGQSSRAVEGLRSEAGSPKPVRQIVSEEGVTEIMELQSNRLRVRAFRFEDVSRSGEIYTPKDNSQPIALYDVKTSSGAAGKSVEFTESRDNNTYTTLYQYNPQNAAWEVSTTGIAGKTEIKGEVYSTSSRSTITWKDSVGEVVRIKIIEKDRQGRVTQVTVDDEVTEFEPAASSTTLSSNYRALRRESEQTDGEPPYPFESVQQKTVVEPYLDQDAQQTRLALTTQEKIWTNPDGSSRTLLTKTSNSLALSTEEVSKTESGGVTTEARKVYLGATTDRETPVSTSTTVSYDSTHPWPLTGKIKHSTDERGVRTSYDYIRGHWTDTGFAADPQGRALKVVSSHAAPNGENPQPVPNFSPVSIQFYDAQDRLVRTEDHVAGTGNTLFIAAEDTFYNALNRVSKRVRNGRIVYEAAYNPQGRLLREIDQNGRTTTYENYDAAGRPTTITLLGLPAQDGLPAIPDKKTLLQYDVLGRLVSRTLADTGESWTWKYALKKFVGWSVPLRREGYYFVTEENYRASASAPVQTTRTENYPHSKRTVTLPSGLQEITEFYLDGREKSRRILDSKNTELDRDSWEYSRTGILETATHSKWTPVPNPRPG
ncbi:MAG: hypothetical protein RLZZ253_1932 [Verrucomicrobiota bacterium]